MEHIILLNVKNITIDQNLNQLLYSVNATMKAPSTIDATKKQRPL